MRTITCIALAALFSGHSVHPLALARSGKPLDQVRFIPMPQMPGGTGIISGIVLTDAGATAPGATVVLAWHNDSTGAEARDNYTGRTVTTDSSGRFNLAAVPQHAVDLSASLGEWTPVEYGQAGPGLPGTPIRLYDGERLTVTLKLARGATISGTMFDKDGTPAGGIQVYAFRMRPISDTDQLMAGGGDAITDEHGAYAIGRLPPGRFIVSAYRAQPNHEQAPIQRIGPNQFAVADGRFFRDAPDTSSAEQIELKAGELRTGVDVRLGLTPVTTVSGIVRDAADKPVAGVRLWLKAPGMPFLEKSTSGPDGAFEITRVVAGRYDLVAALGEQVARLAVVSDGEAPVEVEPRLHPEPGGIVRGRFVIAADAKRPMPAVVWVFLDAVSGVMHYDSPNGGGQQASPDFIYRGVPPGSYVVSASDVARAGLRIKSEMVDGIDAADFPFEVTSGSQHDVLITVTDHLASLSGQVADSLGAPGLRHTVVVFATDTRFWGDRSRRIFADRPDTHGQYYMRDIAAGEYAVALAPADLYGQPSTKLLRDLLPSAQRIIIRDGQPAVCNLRAVR